MQCARRFPVALAFLLLGAPLGAQDEPRPVEVHAYGDWTYGRTSHNVFLAGSPEGDYEQLAMALNLSKRINDKLSIHSQGFVESHGATDVGLDYAFAEYRLNHFLSFRIGQVKHPFGIYTEVFDVGTLRPFIDLPQAFYGPAGFAGESYKGIGASGAADVGAWTLAYDVYAGGSALDELTVPREFYQGRVIDGAETVEKESLRNVIGGRAVLQTPIRGLTLGSSTYTGTVNEAGSPHRSVFAGQIGYRSNVLTLESEIARAAQVDDERAIGGYVLAAYRLTPEWQVAAQYNQLRSQFSPAIVTTAPSLQEHRERVFALSRWMTRAFVIKAEYHHIRGNRLAMPRPEDLAGIIAANKLRLTTHLFQFGAQFAY
jgi:hypothetical protein